MADADVLVVDVLVVAVIHDPTDRLSNRTRAEELTE